MNPRKAFLGILILTGILPSLRLQAQNCIPKGDCSGGGHINFLKVGDKEFSWANCKVYLKLDSPFVSVRRGDAVSIKAAANSKTRPWWGIWADWNRDGDFDDAGEFLSAGKANDSLVYALNLLTGTQRDTVLLRVRSGLDSAFQSADACSASSSGSTADIPLILLPTLPMKVESFTGQALPSQSFAGRVQHPLFHFTLSAEGKLQPLALTSLAIVLAYTDSAWVGAHLKIWRALGPVLDPLYISQYALVGSAKLKGKSLILNLSDTLSAGRNDYFLTIDVPQPLGSKAALGIILDSAVVSGKGIKPAKGLQSTCLVKASYPYCPVSVLNPQQITRRYVGITAIKAEGIWWQGPDGDSLTQIQGSAVGYADNALNLEVSGSREEETYAAIWADWNNDGFFQADELWKTDIKLNAGTAKSLSLIVPCNISAGPKRVRIMADASAAPAGPCASLQHGSALEFTLQVQLRDKITPKIPAVAYHKAPFAISLPTLPKGVSSVLTSTGNVYIEPGPVLYYQDTGTRTISVSFTDSSCGKVTKWAVSQKISVRKPSAAPKSGFSCTDTVVTTADAVTLLDESTNGAWAWNWQVSPKTINGQPAWKWIKSDESTQYPQIQFLKPGNYTVKLSAGNAFGWGDTLEKAGLISVVNAYQLKGDDTLTDVSAIITDDGGKAGLYKRSKTASWAIIPPCADKIDVYLDFSDIVAETPSLKGGDALWISDGNGSSARQIKAENHRLTALPSPVFTSLTGSVLLHWESDSTMQGNGFVLRYTAIKSASSKLLPLKLPDTIWAGKPWQPAYSVPPGLPLWKLDGKPLPLNPEGLPTITVNDTSIHRLSLKLTGCQVNDSFTLQFRAKAPLAKPVISFAANYTEASVGDIVRLSSQAPASTISFKWNIQPKIYEFASGSTDTSRNPVLLLRDTGALTVQLVAANFAGTSAVSKSNYIRISLHCKPKVQAVREEVGFLYSMLSDSSGTQMVLLASSAGQESYIHHHNIPPTIVAGSLYRMQWERPASTLALRSGLWMDINADGDFEDEGEELSFAPAISGNVWGCQFRAPISGKGLLRMRYAIGMGDKALTPCGSMDIAEFEDFSVILHPDTVPPVITLNGPATMYLEEFAKFSDPGVSATDNFSRPISITVYGRPDSSRRGTSEITYTATDWMGNASMASRTIQVIADTTAPQILAPFGDTVRVEAFHAIPSPLVIISENTPYGYLLVKRGSADSSALGYYPIDFMAADSMGNFTVQRIVVWVRDTTPPSFISHGADTILHQAGLGFSEADYITPTDNVSISPRVFSSQLIDESTPPGIYDLQIWAMDDAGNVSQPNRRIIKCVDTIAPLLSLVHHIIKHAVFEPFNGPPILATDNYWQTLDIRHTGQVIYYLPGEYRLIYWATDPSGNRSPNDTTLVIVGDFEAPQLYLMGDTSITLSPAEKFIEPGYLIIDNFDPKAKVSVTGNYYAGAPLGRYYLDYEASDKSGNHSQTLRRQITVTDGTGIEELEKESPYHVFVSGSSISAELLTGQGEIKLWNSSGQLIAEAACLPGKAFRAGNLSAGVYWMVLSSQKEQYRLPILIK